MLGQAARLRGEFGRARPLLLWQAFEAAARPRPAIQDGAEALDVLRSLGRGCRGTLGDRARPGGYRRCPAAPLPRSATNATWPTSSRDWAVTAGMSNHRPPGSGGHQGAAQVLREETGSPRPRLSRPMPLEPGLLSARLGLAVEAKNTQDALRAGTEPAAAAATIPTPSRWSARSNLVAEGLGYHLVKGPVEALGGRPSTGPLRWEPPSRVRWGGREWPAAAGASRCRLLAQVAGPARGSPATLPSHHR